MSSRYSDAFFIVYIGVQRVPLGGALVEVYRSNILRTGTERPMFALVVMATGVVHIAT